MTSVKLDPAGFFARIPLQPHQLKERVTPVADTIVLCHLGVPRIAAADWSLSIGGLVRKPLHLTHRDLLSLPCVDIPAVHECAGSPLDPTTPKRRVCNVIWTGVPLAELLKECGVEPEARFVWSSGSDWGAFGGQSCEAYVKDLPIERVGEDVLIAHRMNGEALRPEAGFPARLVVPGFYGTNSVKWISRIELTDRRPAGPFTTTFYNDPVLDEAGKETGQRKPVWNIAPGSLIVSPEPEMSLALGIAVEVWGWAWGDGGVETVEISSDGGLTWMPAQFEKSAGRTWQKFSSPWTPSERGEHLICCRATNFKGESQPMFGARNAIYQVRVEVS